jgi:hypothetical protein
MYGHITPLDSCQEPVLSHDAMNRSRSESKCSSVCSSVYILLQSARHSPPTQQLCIQVIRSHQQLQAQLWWDIHIRHVDLILVLLIIQEIFANFLENDATAKGDRY